MSINFVTKDDNKLFAQFTVKAGTPVVIAGDAAILLTDAEIEFEAHDIDSVAEKLASDPIAYGLNLDVLKHNEGELSVSYGAHGKRIESKKVVAEEKPKGKPKGK